MSKDLAEISDRKRELLLESEINRQILQLEFGQISAKTTEWRQSFGRLSSIAKWVAPLAGVGFGFLSARKQLRSSRKPHRHGDGKLGYLTLLAPLSMGVLKQGLAVWRKKKTAERPVP